MIGKIVFIGSVIIIVGVAIIEYIRHPEDWLVAVGMLAMAGALAAIGFAKKTPST